MTAAVEYIERSQNIGLTQIAPYIDMRGRIVAITGAAAGIGRELSRAVHRFGGTVIAIDIQVEKLEELKDELGGKRFIFGECDLMKPISKDFKAALAEICEYAGKIDGYVMNAAVQKLYPYNVAKDFLTTPNRERTLIGRINVDSHRDIYQVLHPHLVKSDAGRVVVTSSSVIGRSDPALEAYTQSKRGIVDMAYHIEPMTAGTSILVNAYAPPPVQTFLRADYKNEPLYANAAPADVVELPLRLLSPGCVYNDTMFVFVDNRIKTTAGDGSEYQYNVRDSNGFLFEIRKRSPLNKGEKLEGEPLVQSYNTWASRQLTGNSKLPPIDESKPIRALFPPPPYITHFRKSM